MVCALHITVIIKKAYDVTVSIHIVVNILLVWYLQYAYDFYC